MTLSTLIGPLREKGVVCPVTVLTPGRPCVLAFRAHGPHEVLSGMSQEASHRCSECQLQRLQCTIFVYWILQRECPLCQEGLSFVWCREQLFWWEQQGNHGASGMCPGSCAGWLRDWDHVMTHSSTIGTCPMGSLLLPLIVRWTHTPRKIHSHGNREKQILLSKETHHCLGPWTSAFSSLTSGWQPHPTQGQVAWISCDSMGPVFSWTTRFRARACPRLF